MTGAPPHLRLERQVDDAAKRLHRTSGCPVLIAAALEVDGATGVGFSVHGLTSRQQELAHFMLLQRLADDLQPGAAADCPKCSAAWARISAAVEALRPGFAGPDADHGGCC